MPRIRTIKPEFLRDPGVCSMSFEARYLYIALWMWADDLGYGTFEPREVLGFAFPRDEEIDVGIFRRLVGEIRRHVGVKFYMVGGAHFYQIQTWSKHQKTDARVKASKCPPFEEGVEIDPETMLPLDGESSQVDSEVGESRRHVGGIRRQVGGKHLQVGEIQRDTPVGTGEQGNRGTGEQEIMINPADAGSIDTTTLDQLFNEFWAAYPRHVGKKAARTKFATATKTTDPKTIIEGAKRYAEAVKDSDPTYIAHPTTWLNQGRWEDEPPQPKTTTSSINDWLPATTTTPIVEAEVTQLTWDDELPPAHKPTKIGW